RRSSSAATRASRPAAPSRSTSRPEARLEVGEPRRPPLHPLDPVPEDVPARIVDRAELLADRPELPRRELVPGAPAAHELDKVVVPEKLAEEELEEPLVAQVEDLARLEQPLPNGSLAARGERVRAPTNSTARLLL